MCHIPKDHWQGAHLCFRGHEPIGGNTTIVCDQCDARSMVIFQAYICTKLILLGDRGTRGTFPGLHPQQRRIEPTFIDHKSSRLTAQPPSHTRKIYIFSEMKKFFRFNGCFSRWTGVNRFLLELRVMEELVTTGDIRRAKLQSKRHHHHTSTKLFTGRMSDGLLASEG